MKIRRLILWLATGVIVTIITLMMLCGVVYSFLDGWASGPSPSDRIRQQTIELLQEVEFQAGKAIPTYTVRAESAVSLCGNVLPEAMKRNNNKYSLVIVGVWGDYASPIPGGTGSIEAVVNIEFPDGVRLQLQYYAYTLDGCRELSHSIELF
jgi:hypothetical protein